MDNINKAIITSGGVDLVEINPKTMESKIRKGLYFAGEIMDIDALTGGFNLQVAFSTGYMYSICAIIYTCYCFIADKSNGQKEFT